MGITTDADSLTQDDDAVTFHATVLTLGSFDRADVCFQWRKYPGFAMAVYENDWQMSNRVTVSAEGGVSVRLNGLEPGVTYQYRAVIENAMNRMQGDMTLFVKE